MQFNYEVDRDSPTSKLRGLIEWSHDIIDDIKYTRKIMSNPFTRFFATYWFVLSKTMSRFFVCLAVPTRTVHCY